VLFKKGAGGGGEEAGQATEARGYSPEELERHRQLIDIYVW
jgi:hypothetical protein